MKNITISLKDELAHWIRVHAAENGQSASALLAKMIENLKQREVSYGRAMSKFLNSPINALKSGSQKYPSREELHERR